MAKQKKADTIRQLYNLANSWTRKQWENTNQKGYDFAHDEQITRDEREALEAQGMPTFTVNRILPVVEMLNFYATANSPRWQAIGIDGSDVDLAAVISDLTDYVWHNSNGATLYNNAINDSVTKGVGYMLVSVDQDADNGMGEVVLTQPEPFDLYVDPKSRDMLFKDAAFIMIRKVLPKEHLIKLFPDQKRKIAQSSSNDSQNSYTQRRIGEDDQKLFEFNDINEQMSEGVTAKGEMDQLVEFFEVYEKIKVSYVNFFYRVPPDEKQLDAIKQQCEAEVKAMEEELSVQLKEQEAQMSQALASGEMLEDRFELEMEKAVKMMQDQLTAFKNECYGKLMEQASRVENQIIPEKDFNELMKDEEFAKYLVDKVQFYSSRIKQTCVAGDKLLYEKILPDSIKEYPVVPFHFKWTGTPFPMSAVAPLIGKQQEINKAHQIMVHNASLGSSLRWMYEEGSIDADLWEKYSSSPGALLPIRPGVERPTPVMPAPLSNAFFSIVQQGKSDMEYLAGIYSSMMGDAGSASETYRGMLAMDEYGTRRIKQWMSSCIEPALKQLGDVVLQFCQATYTAQKRFRIVQPSAIQEGKTQEINIPIYNDLGEAIGKSMDINETKFDIRIISGSTLPVNRWAYLEELKQLMQLGVVDDIAVLAETDIRNKENIVERKSLYAQLEGQVQQLQEQLQDSAGTIETLERQLVQAGIKGKVMQAEMEITKKKEDVKSNLNKEYLETESKQKLLRGLAAGNENLNKARAKDILGIMKKDLENRSDSE
tara:strand:- start:2422 stop:4722 length:2301 start_codon:yes stop_codon:yes gene_type:complete